MPSSKIVHRVSTRLVALALSAAVLGLAGGCQHHGKSGAAAGPFDGRGPRPTAEAVLNADLPWKAADTRRPLERDETGYARDRLYSVPPAGQHPRILFGPADLPRVRAQLSGPTSARAIAEAMRARLKKALDSTDAWQSQAYRTLVAGDVETFRAKFGTQERLGRAGPPGANTNEFYAILVDRAFFALIDNDEVAGKEVATAIATYCRFQKPRIEAAAAENGAENYWLVVRNIMPDGPSLGFMYDFAYPFMTDDQRQIVRSTIAAATNGRYGLGMNLPHQWRNWNFIGMGLQYPLIALAIEGEEGYDPRVYARGAEVANDYALYGASAVGTGREGIGYHTGGMVHTATLGLAMANRGDHLFTLKRWRQQFESWLLWTMQPYGGEWVSSGDLGTFPPNATLVHVARYFFPASPGIAHLNANVSANPPLEKFDGDRFLQLLCPGNLTPLPEVALASLGLGTTLHDTERGLLWARTGWEKDSAALHVACRDDTTFPSHDFADRGSFYFTALGQAWAVTGMRETETRYNNCISIDGRGQGYFPPPGKWLGVTDGPLGTFATLDTKYCYDWQWQKSSFFQSDAQYAAQPWLAVFKESRDRLLSRFPIGQWEHDPLPSVKAYYGPFVQGNPRMWGDEDSWVVRAPHYPVQRSFRTVGLVRGNHPYTVVVDDIQKDTAEHLYQWRMTIPMEVEPYEFKGPSIVLGRLSPQRSDRAGSSAYKDKGKPVAKKGDPMLLVRIVSAAQPAIPAFGENPTVETLDFVKYDDTHQFTGRSLGMGKRLVIPSRSVAPDFKVLLIPYRQGEEQPKVTTSADGATVTVAFKDQTDVITFGKQPDGRTRVRLERGGQVMEIK